MTLLPPELSSSDPGMGLGGGVFIFIAVTPLINSCTRHFSLSLNSDSPGDDMIFRFVEARFRLLFAFVPLFTWPPN